VRRAASSEPAIARAIGGSLAAARSTDGAVDPTIGRALRITGYDADFDQIAGTSRPLELRLAPVPGWSVIAFDPARRTVRVPSDVELDLGSTGKGLASDLSAAAALEAAGPNAGVLVSLGGDVAVAGRAPEGGWRILMAEDSNNDPEGTGEVVAIERGGLATSSTTVRQWKSDLGATLHHIMDPRTGLPAETPWRTATVVADTCEAANAASTACIVLGRSAPDWLAQAGLPARLVARDGTVVRLGGWPEPASDDAAGEATRESDVEG
jgi:thiamine biosynthesis lipoprotein